MFAKTLESTGPTLPAEAAEVECPWGGALTDEEGALLSVLRLLNRSALRQDLSPVERAFVAGAQTMFEALSSTCEQLLEQAASDETMRGLTPPEKELESVGGGDDEEETKPRRKKSATRRSKRGGQKST